MLPVIQVGRAAIQLKGLILIIGLWIGLSLTERYSNKRGISSAQINNLILLMLVGGLIGARLSYIIRYPEVFVRNPVSTISLNPGLLDLWGGSFAAILVGVIFSRRQAITIFKILDALTPMLAVLAIAISLSNLASGEAFGKPASYPWSIYLWGMERHPTQIYLAAAHIFILLVLWPGKWAYDKNKPGEYFFLYMVLTLLAILFLEYFRGDSQFLIFGIRSRQIVQWMILAACLYILGKLIQPDITTSE